MSDQRRDPRYAVGLLVRLNHPDVGTFVERFATNLSPGGIFIRTRTPKAPGTAVRFEVQIAAGRRVLAGEAVVRWARDDGDPSGAPGMGLEFVRLDPASRALVDRMLAARRPETDPEDEGTPPTASPPPLPGEDDGTPPTASPPPLGDLDDATTPPGATPPPLASLDDAPAYAPPPLSIDIPTESLVATTPPPAPASPPAAGVPFSAAPEIEIHVDLSEGAEAFDDEDDLDVDVEETAAEAFPKPEPVYLEAPETLPEDGPVIGIDLGTTNSCIAFFRDGRPAVIQSREGYNTVPSVVALSVKDKLLVAHPAKSQMLTNPERTVYGAKRLVGRPFSSATVQHVMSHFHYPICADAAGNAAVRLGDEVLSLEEVQGLILRECKAMAEQSLERPVHRAVVTVPAYYSDAQRQAVREAGRLAGLRVERILNEPTAAALAYGLNRELKKRVLIYDLGGGTFDATAMLIDGNVFEVLATGGDTFLGGVDLDEQIVDWLLTRFEASAGIPFNGDQVALSRVSDAAERAKVALSAAQVHEVHIPYLMMDEDGVPHDLACTITRDDLEALTADLVERTLDVVRDVLLDASLKPSDIEEVILVGGQSRMPLVRQKLREMFGRDAHPGVHPDEAVALGAALLAGSLDRVTSVVLIDVLPMTLGIGLPGGRFKRIIERNTPLPVQRTYGIATTRRNQRKIEISVFQGEDTHVSGNDYLGTLVVDGLQRGEKGAVQVAVTFALGPECVLDVAAREVGSGHEVRATLATRDTPEDLRKRLRIDAEAASAAESARAEELTRRGSRFWSLLKRVVGVD
jgi:molecular chaperone DnaK